MEKSKDLFTKGSGGYLENNLLIAMPGLYETSFAQSVILICTHSEDGAVGFMLNKKSEMNFSQFMAKLKAETKSNIAVPDVIEHSIPVHMGGPVDTGRGFVLHTPEYNNDSTVKISDGLSITSTLGILLAIASGQGPKQAILCLGYAGWSDGQIEDEIVENSWLSCPLNDEIVFEPDIDEIYSKTLSTMGVNATQLSSIVGHA